MYLVHAFNLVPLLLVPLALGRGLHRRPVSPQGDRWRRCWRLASAEAVLLLDNQAAYNDFKAIYAPLHTPDAKIVAAVNSPRGDYALLDDFTERVDTDISNNAGHAGGRRAAAQLSACTATATASPPCRNRTPIRSRLCRGGAGRAALPTDPACPGAAGRRLRRLPHRRGAAARRQPGARAGAGTGAVAERCATASARCRRSIRSPNVDVTDRVRTAGRHRSRQFTTSWICQPTSWTQPTPTPPRSPRRRSSRLPARVWRRAGSSPSRSRSAISRSMPCACWRLCAPRCCPPASTIRPATSSSIAPPGTSASWYPAMAGARARSPPRANSATTGRSTCPGIPASTWRRPAAGIYNDLPAVSFDKGEVESRRPGRCDRRRGAGRPVRPAVAVARAVQPVADHAGQAVLLRRAAAGPHRHHPEAAGNPAAGGGRRAGQPRGAGSGSGDRGAGAAGAACRARADPAPRAGRAAVGRSTFRRSRWASCSSRSI